MTQILKLTMLGKSKIQCAQFPVQNKRSIKSVKTQTKNVFISIISNLFNSVIHCMISSLQNTIESTEKKNR